MKGLQLTTEQATFLARFTGRGWLHAAREDAVEREAVDFGLRKRWLRREGSEVHFTQRGRVGLSMIVQEPRA